jgi:hypothetical protein
MHNQLIVHNVMVIISFILWEQTSPVSKTAPPIYSKTTQDLIFVTHVHQTVKTVLLQKQTVHHVIQIHIFININVIIHAQYEHTQVI